MDTLLPPIWRTRFNDALVRLQALEPNKKIFIYVVLAAVFALFVGALFYSRDASYKILFANLSDRDGGQVTALLQQLNIPYQLSAGGVISVPEEDIYEVRLKLAAQGLPKAGGVGFELMDNQKFGISQFAEQVNYQRAIEGELARTIESIDAVESARVHIATPKQSVFVRQKEPTTASVMLTLSPGRLLDTRQIAGVMYLVSSAVPGLPLKQVTVLDQDGNLLSQMPDVDNTAGLNQRQLKYVRQIEEDYIARIETILEPMFGRGHARAQVSATVDFTDIEQTSETYRPNSSPNPSSTRSQQIVEKLASTGTQAAGVPGALSNQPPSAASAPITLPPGVAPGTQTLSGQSIGKGLTERDMTTNYEVDKTIAHMVMPKGTIKRLTAAVVVNYRPTPNRNGLIKPTPLTAREMQQVNDLVKEAMGFNAERGDSMNVVNVAFAKALAVASLKERTLDYVNEHPTTLIKYALIGLVGLYLLFGVIRPLLRVLVRQAAKAPEPSRAGGAAALSGGGGSSSGGNILAVVGEEEGASFEEGDQLKVSERDVHLRRLYAHHLEVARGLVKDDPRMAAQIIKEWISAEDVEAGVKRSAVLLFSLGQSQAVEVFKYLGPKEVQKISLSMAAINNLSHEEIDKVIAQFREECAARASIGASDEYLRNVLIEALGPDKAANLLDKIMQGNDHSGIESLKWMDPSSAADLIRNEHPQIIATILVHLDPDLSSSILAHFSERMRNEVLIRTATLEGVQPQALRELNDVLTQLLSGSDRIKKSAAGGVGMTAEILNFMGNTVEASALNYIREYDPELAQRIQDKMFVFENLLEIDDRSIQTILREVQSDSLVMALKGTSQELKDKIFRNMSQRAAEMLRDDLEAKGPVKLSEVEAEQKEILKIVRKLADDGQIVLGSKGGDEGLVE